MAAPKHFLQLKDFSRDELEHVFARTRWIKGQSKRYEPYHPLFDRTLVMIFRVPAPVPWVHCACGGATFDRTLELLGISFRVTCANDSSVNELRIAPSSLEIDNTPVARTIEGTVAGAEAADLDGDGSPEIYVFITSAGSGSYGSLVAYAANRRKSLSEVYLPPFTQEVEASLGYQGHDEFTVAGNALVRRFPVYRAGDTNAAPTGGTRQLEYRLMPGEGVRGHNRPVTDRRAIRPRQSVMVLKKGGCDVDM